MEQFRNEVELTALDLWSRLQTFHRSDCSHSRQWTSPWLSSCGGRSSVLPMLECMWWQDRWSCRQSSRRLSSCGGRAASSNDYIHIRFLHCGLVGEMLVNSKMVIVEVMLVTQHQVPFYYDTVLYSNSRLLYSTVKKKKKKKNGRFVTRFRGADHTQPPAGHQVMEFPVDLG